MNFTRVGLLVILAQCFTMGFPIDPIKDLITPPLVVNCNTHALPFHDSGSLTGLSTATDVSIRESPLMRE